MKFLEMVLNQRIWLNSHSFNSEIISHVLDFSGLRSTQDVANDLKKNRIKKSKKQIDAFTEALNRRINPFVGNVDKNILFNISTGQAASKEVTDFLLNVEITGESGKKLLIDTCSYDKNNFDKFVVKKNKILNFTSKCKKRLLKVGVREKEITVQKDLFGRLLGISLENNIDLEKVI